MTEGAVYYTAMCGAREAKAMEYQKAQQEVFNPGVGKAGYSQTTQICGGISNAKEHVRRETASEELMVLSRRAIDRLENYVLALEGRLQGVLNPPNGAKAANQDQACRCYPPLLSEFRNHVFSVDNMADKLNDIIERLEV